MMLRALENPVARNFPFDPHRPETLVCLSTKSMKSLWLGFSNLRMNLAAGFQLLILPRGKLFSCWEPVAIIPIEMRYLTLN